MSEPKGSKTQIGILIEQDALKLLRKELLTRKEKHWAGEIPRSAVSAGAIVSDAIRRMLDEDQKNS